MASSILVPIFLWLIVFIALAFKKEMVLSIKILVGIMLLAFIIFWWSELHVSVVALFEPTFLSKDFGRIVCNRLFVALPWIWPIVIINSFISKDNGANLIILIVLSVLTIFAILGFLYFGFYSLG